jgi:pimeloyl-ACP methyl ester carboxylesterase
VTLSAACDHEQGWKIATFAILRAMSYRPRSLRRAFAALLVCAAAAVADAPAHRFDCARDIAPTPSGAEGRVLILPGVGNTRFHLAGFVAGVQRQLPRFDVEVRTWGKPFLTIHNLRAHERNVETASHIAAEIADWRRAHPEAPFYLVGYSGGGAMATLVTAALPQDIEIDRLVLVAPAISPDYPLASEVLPHVREYAVNYASERDLQVGWGTRTFGTIDRKYTASAGAIGFAAPHERLLEHHWSAADKPLGHAGNHLAYLSARWQAAKLLPALDPSFDAQALAARLARTCKES